MSITTIHAVAFVLPAAFAAAALVVMAASKRSTVAVARPRTNGLVWFAGTAVDGTDVTTQPTYGPQSRGSSG